MEEIFDNIIEAQDNLEEIFDGLGNRTLQDYYALFISEMAYCGYLEISDALAAKIYVNILNTSITEPDEYLRKIYDFLMNKTIEAFEKAPVDEKSNS